MHFIVIAVSFVVAWVTTRALISLLLRRGILDVPNARSSHQIPTPRGGGIGIIMGVIAGALAAWWLGMQLPAAGLFAGALLMALVGFMDDRLHGLPVPIRLALQLAAAAVAVFGTDGLTRLPLPEPFSISLGFLSLPIAVLWIVAVTNIYNFLDGIDGYAGAQGVIAGLGLALLDPTGLMAPIGFAIAGACGGFLLLNWHPAKIFMGDVGSGTLGFLLAAIPFQLNSPSRLGAVFAVGMCLWFFLSDGVFTILRRLIRGEKVWEAHCSHLYQRLVKSGLRHDRVVLIVGGAAMLVAGATVFAERINQPSGQWLVLTGAIITFLFYAGWTRARERALQAGETASASLVPSQSRGRAFWIWKFPRARQLHLVLDLMVLVTSFVLAYLLRFDFQIPKKELWDGLIQLPYVVIIQFVLLLLAGVYSFIWRYIGMSEVRVFITAALWSALPVLVMRIVLPVELQVWRVPLSIIFIDTVLAFGGVLGLRVVRRAIYERYQKRRKTIQTNYAERESVLLIGAGRAGVMTAKEILSRGEIKMEIRGFVDDDPTKQGSVIHGIKVLGTVQDLPQLVAQLKIDHVVITLAQASRNDFRRILEVCRDVPVKARIIPGLNEILQGRVTVSRIRDVQIEDLLGREPIHLDEAHVQSFLTGKAAMVTGAGGSIGSELARQVARFQPSHLMLAERSECALFNIDRELRATHPHLNIVTLVADIGDESRMRSIFQARCPQVVLHAAAHKHVPMMEANPCEAIKNNVLATRLLGQIAGEFGTEAFVMISTDKAVRPTSVMGAAKRVAELAVQDLNRQFPTRYLTVRFGNVIGSAGSVIPIFQEQIRKGGPVTVTHPDMVRYFMTIPEAAQLVLQAGSMGQGSEIFILDMGEPVRILDIAKETITLSGLKPFEDIDVVFTGLRDGEKLFEELEMTDEHMTKTRHPKIFIGKIAAYPEEQVQHALQKLAIISRAGREPELRRFLNELLPEARVKVTDEESPGHEEEPVLQLTTAAGVS